MQQDVWIQLKTLMIECYFIILTSQHWFSIMNINNAWEKTWEMQQDVWIQL